MPAKPFLAPAVEATYSRLQPMVEEAMKKAMLDMSHELMASAKAKRPIRTAVSAPLWPFGTVVRWPETGITVLVLVDDGQTCHALDFGDSQVHTLKRDKYVLVATP